MCDTARTFTVWRVPEYTLDGMSALSRNIVHSDGTMLDGTSKGTILDGIPASRLRTLGITGPKRSARAAAPTTPTRTSFDIGKNVYILFDCAEEFTKTLEETVAYTCADSSYHTKTTTGGSYCGFCYGTHKEESSVLERHPHGNGHPA